jgi:hypothetical protein
MTATTSVPRVIIAVAGETDDDIWGAVERVQRDLFVLGPVAIKLAYFGAEDAGRRRPFISTRWSTDPDDMANLIDHARDHCVCGCFVDIASVIEAAIAENRQEKVEAVVIIGDHLSYPAADKALSYAKQLSARGTKLFMGLQATPKEAMYSGVFKDLAQQTGGAFFAFDPYTERVAERLPDFLRSIAQFAVGGTEALRTLDSQCATLLLEQIRTNEAALFDVKAVSLPDRLPRVRNRD